MLLLRSELPVSCNSAAILVPLPLSQVLTISGRTIRREAQESPEAAAEAEEAIDSFLKTVRPSVALVYVTALMHSRSL